MLILLALTCGVPLPFCPLFPLCEIVAYTFLHVVIKIHQLLSGIEKDARKKKIGSFFSASRCSCFFVRCVRADLTISSQQVEAYNYYKRNTMSIEILKDDYLQKVNFRVKNKVSGQARGPIYKISYDSLTIILR